MKYTPETLAALLNGREYGSEITREDTLMTTQSCGELFMKRFVATAVGSVFNGEHDCECEFCGFKKAKEKAHEIKAVWGEGEYSWSYKTDTAHATFEIVDEDEKYCLGIVFRLGDIK
jgi:hypothetical protein